MRHTGRLSTISLSAEIDGVRPNPRSDSGLRSRGASSAESSRRLLSRAGLSGLSPGRPPETFAGFAAEAFAGLFAARCPVMSFVAAAFGVAVAVTARTFVGSGSAGAGVTSGAFLAFGTFVFDSASGGAEIALGAFEYHIFAELAFESAVVHVEFLRGREAYLVEVVVVIAYDPAW